MKSSTLVGLLPSLSGSITLRIRELFRQSRRGTASRHPLRSVGYSAMGIVSEVLEDRTLLATFFVNDDGGGDFTTIQAAIDNAVSGDTIIITGGGDGIHEEQGILVDKDLTIEGMEGTTQVIVQAHDQEGMATDRVFEITFGTTATIDNLTIRHGNADSFFFGGGGIFNNGNLTLTDSNITANSANFANGGGVSNTGTVNVINSTISGNSAFQGGGIDNGGTLSVTNSTISGNSASSGGGISNYGFGNTMNVADSTISGNSASYGGGIYNSGGGTMDVTDSTISGNSASYGGGIYNRGSGTVTNSTISENSASFRGGGIYNGGSGTFDVTDSTISGNSAESEGGGIYNGGGSTLNVTGSTISGNTASYGGGIYNNAYSGVLNVTNSTISGNIFDNVVGVITTFSIMADPANPTEGENGELVYRFIVTRDTDFDSATVDFAVSGDNLDPDDFVGGEIPEGTLVFDPGTSEQIITIRVVARVTADPLEEFTVTLFNPTPIGTTAVSGAAGAASASVASTANLILAGVTLPEGTGGGTTAFTFTVTLDTTVVGGFNLAYTTNDGTATVADGDYVPNQGTLVFAGTAGEVQTITVLVNQDAKVEADEFFSVVLGPITGLDPGIDPARVIVGGPQIGTILNDDMTSITIENLGVSNGVFEFEVRSSNAVDGSFALDFSTEDDTAIAANGDYTPTSGTLTFSGTAGETQRITVPINPDLLIEGTPKTFKLNLGSVRTVESPVDVADLSLVTTTRIAIIFEGELLKDIFVTAAGPGGGPHVRVFSASDSTEVLSFFAYDPGFTGGVRVATSDVNGDGVPDIITGPGPGGGPHIKVFDGLTGAEIHSFFAFDPSFTGGVYLAAADFNEDGRAEIIVAADAGGGPHVKVFDLTDATLTPLFSFFAYSSGFTGGVRVAAGDVNGDGTPDIITGAGVGGGPHIRVFSGTDLSDLRSFFAFDPGFLGGVFVASGDFNQDNMADIVVGAGAGGGPHVRVLSGANGLELFGRFAYDPNFTGGVLVAVTDLNGDGLPDLVTAPATSMNPRVVGFDGNNPQVTLLNFLAFHQNFFGGVFVAGSFTPPSTSALSLDAAGLDWFSDPTPVEDLEFQTANLEIQGQEDPVTVSTHELGFLHHDAEPSFLSGRLDLSTRPRIEEDDLSVLDSVFTNNTLPDLLE